MEEARSASMYDMHRTMYYRVGYLSVGLAVLIAGALLGAQEQDGPTSFEALFQKLRARRCGRYLRENRAPRLLRELAAARFAATEAICAEIDRTDSADVQYIADLYGVLGIVKDPKSLGWLRQKLSTRDAEYIYGSWLTKWITRQFGMYDTSTYLTIKWISEPARWRDFMLRLRQHAPNENARFRVLQALTRCFHDDRTISAIAAMERTRNLSPRELLVIQTYLLEHEHSIDADRLSKVLDELLGSEEGALTLFAFGTDLHHENVVPAMISQVGAQVDQPEGVVSDALRGITFQYQLSTKAQWEAWYAANKMRSRRAWVDSALNEMDVLVEKDTPAAERLIDSHWLGDPVIADHVMKWSRHRELHRVIARWIVRSYHQHWRERLKPIARRVVEESLSELDWCGRDGLKELDFIPHEECSWRELVLP